MTPTEGGAGKGAARLSPMQLVVRPGLHHALAGGRMVFLDVAADRYFCLPAQLDRAMQRILAGEPAEDEGIAALVREEILVRSDPRAGEARAGARLEAAESSVVDSDWPAGDFEPRAAAKVGWCVVRAAIMERRLGFGRRLEWVRKTRPAASERSARDPDLAREIALRFQHHRPLVPLARGCQRDSYALIRYLAAHGIAARLVIGVALDPFAAHCWVQSGSVVLNDYLDHVAVFSPILAV